MNDPDNASSYDTIDTARMRERLSAMSDQCEEAYAAGQHLPLPDDYRSVRQVVIAGMGGSGLGAEIVQSWCTLTSTQRVTTWRGYGLPPFATGPQTLIIAISKSGQTEETLSAFVEATRRGCALMAITTGGVLARLAQERGIPLLTFTFPYQAREAIGWLTFPLLAILGRMGYLPDSTSDVEETVKLLRETTVRINVDVPAVHNPVKRMAGQVMDRLPIIYGAGVLAPVARRWKMTLNETAKLLAIYDELPELNHSSVAGYLQPEAIWQKAIVIQLRSTLDTPRIAQRFDLTTRLMLECGINQDTVRARGTSALAQVFSLVQYGDWMSYYAAVMSGVDPTPTEPITWLKQELEETNH